MRPGGGSAAHDNIVFESYEFRAATSLARLWRDPGQRAEAYDLLAPDYGWFTRGFDTADLKDAGRCVISCDEWVGSRMPS